MIKIKGIYTEEGKIELETLKTIEWKDLSDEKLPGLPSGSKVELTISFDKNDFLTGRNGIVWATYDKRQAEIIQNTLLAQNINSETGIANLGGKQLILIKITSQTDMKDAIEFIWKSNNGLRLKPDWSYPDGEKNKSFEQWLSGH